jgi:hypothetical protein
MAKPEAYKGEDAVKLKCLKDYTVKAGSGANAGDDIEFAAGSTYSLSPRSAAHMMRKLYAVREDRGGRLVYVGDAPYFVDEKAAAEMAEAEAARAAADEGKALDKMTVAELNAVAEAMDTPPEGWGDMKRDEKVAALTALASE